MSFAGWEKVWKIILIMAYLWQVKVNPTFKFLLFWHRTYYIYFRNSRSKCAEELEYILPHHDHSQAYQDYIFQGTRTSQKTQLS